MKISIPQHSIVMLIGPSNCGKSYFADLIMNDYLQGQDCSAIKLSSDEERRKLLFDSNKHKHDPKMMTVSKQAFSLMHNQLDNYTQYPVNTDIVIVDATHLSKMGRSDVLNYARKNNYNLIGIIFDYKNMDDYYEYAGEGVNRRVIADMVNTLRKITIKELERKEFKALYKIPSNDFSQLEFEYIPGSTTNGHQNTHGNVCIVGDLHGCYEELLDVLKDEKGIVLSDEEIPTISKVEGQAYVHHILIGDLIDKGSHDGVRKILELIYKNREFFTIVKGNHEEHNYKVLTGLIKRTDEENKLIDNFFDCVRLFDSDADLKAKFMELYAGMYYYVYDDRFIITHAPCENKYLGKNDKISLKRQNTIMYPKSKDYENSEDYLAAREDFFKFLITDSESNYPTHVFGHVMLPSVFSNKNKYGIDTGCVVGNMLSTLTFARGNKRPFVKKYRSRTQKKEDLVPFFRVKINYVDVSALDLDLYNRLKWCARNKVNFVSGTMSPADKDAATQDIESLEKGLAYFKGQGIDTVILQPKYMGSRCNALIHRTDVKKSRLYSRNAFEIEAKRINMTEEVFDAFLASIAKKYSHVFDHYNAEYILFDGELLPWNIMGKALIERDFKVPSLACSSEVDILSATGFEDHFDALKLKYGNLEEGAVLKNHEVAIKKVVNNFTSEMLSIDATTEVLTKYNHQLSIFAADSEPEFKAFSILKLIKTDGSETNFISNAVSNIEMFDLLGSNNIAPYLVINFSDEGYLTAAYKFWDAITNRDEMEGIVIKPEKAYVPGVAPYMKVRNKEYLRLTYGFDYDVLEVKRKKLIDTKSINRKLQTSVKEYELGRQLLNVKLSDISLDNQEWVSLTLQLLSEQEKEKELDPRL